MLNLKTVIVPKEPQKVKLSLQRHLAVKSQSAPSLLTFGLSTTVQVHAMRAGEQIFINHLLSF